MRSARESRPRRIVLVAAVLYAVALTALWIFGTAKAERRIYEMLHSAETGYAATVHGEIEAALRNAGGTIINLLGGRFGPQPLERMDELARTFNLDEINFVDRSGRVIASNIPSVMGADFHALPQTREFLTLTNETVTMVSQPFRYGAANPEMYCKYYGMSFPGHVGILQLGISIERLRANMYSYTEEEAEAILRDWHFSVCGWYERVLPGEEFREGGQFRRVLPDGRRALGRYFCFEGYRYAAFLPEGYCYSQRNQMFVISALALAAVVALFVVFLLRLVAASAKLEALHAAAEARTAEDLALARKIQMSALPSVRGVFLERLEFALQATCRPAREVGGDFYDFYHVFGDKLVFLIADASGKGISAAMFMMEAKNVIKGCLSEFTDLSEAVAEANRRLCAENDAEMFLTAWIGVLDPKTGEMEYVNAGHNRPFVRRADGTVEKVMGKGGMFLGMLDDRTYRSHTLKLAPGDRLFLYTDGITEAMNARKEIFGETRLREALSRGEVERELAAFVGGAERSDDLTALVLSWQGAPSVVERRFPCADSSLGPVVSFLREALAGVGRKELAAVLNAADEVTTNIVSYSGAADFRIAVERAPDRLRITFADSGLAYNPLTHVDPDTRAPIEDRPVGGLGLVMVKRLADRVSYARRGGENVLTLIKCT